jgi:hypothetical protein
LATVATIVVLFIVFAGGDDEGNDTSATATTQTQTQTTTAEQAPQNEEEPAVAADEQITIRNGKPVGGVKELSFDSGERVRFVVTSDVADEIHVHGYDVAKDVRAGGSVRFGFPADLEGVFEVELEGRGEQIAELRVSP